jgi:signal transduction histidine kinase
MAENTLKAYEDGGWPLAERVLMVSQPARSTMILYRDGESNLFQGSDDVVPDDSMLEQAEAGQRVSYSRPEGGADLYIPIETRPRTVLFLRLPARGVDAHRGLLESSVTKAAIFSGLVALLLGIGASSLIAVPVRRLVTATQALAASDFHQGIQVGDQGELSELAVSFNSMARRLEETVNSLREAKERAERSEASRRQFMAEVSHNLRTPLAAVQGWTEALLDDLVPGEETVHLRKIHRETLFVAQAVQKLLDWSRWEDTPPVLSLETFPISEALLDSADTLAEAAESKNVELRFHGLEQEPLVVADRHRSREIFQLLLENAVHHNAPGTKIDVSFEVREGRVCVEVADSGTGLPEEFRRDLRCRCGGGLGLAIAARLVEAHGGTLTLLPGPQTRLTFSLAQGLAKV